MSEHCHVGNNLVISFDILGTFLIQWFVQIDKNFVTFTIHSLTWLQQFILDCDILPDVQPCIARPVKKIQETLQWDMLLFQIIICFASCRAQFLESGLVLKQKSQIGLVTGLLQNNHASFIA